MKIVKGSESIVVEKLSFLCICIEFKQAMCDSCFPE